MAEETSKELPQTPGIYEETLTLKNGMPVRYTLSLPSGYKPGKSVPLVMALHYGGTVTPWYSEPFLRYLVEPGLRELKAIIIAPDCPDRDWHNPTVEAAVLELLDFIKSHYPVKERQTVITGFSMGGVGAWYMIARHPEVFSAAVPISSTADQETMERLKDSPIYVFHSDKDEIFPVARMEEIVQTLKKRDVPVKLEILQGISHYHTGKFAVPLKKAVPWLKKVWAK